MNLLLVMMIIGHYIIECYTPVEELPTTVLEEKVIESSNVIRKIKEEAKAGKFKTTEDYNKAMNKVVAKYNPYLKELNKRREKSRKCEDYL